MPLSSKYVLLHDKGAFRFHRESRLFISRPNRESHLDFTEGFNIKGSFKDRGRRQKSQLQSQVIREGLDPPLLALGWKKGP